jgi:AcrR family transcriptional regulator
MKPPKHTWQASKSQLTRNTILEATLECLGHLPFGEVTIATIAECAGISKGGIQYHFPTRHELIQEAINFLFQRRLDNYRVDLAKAPSTGVITDYVIDTHWKHLTEPDFQTYQQLLLASRSNPQLRSLLVQRYRSFRRQCSKLSLASYGWNYSNAEVVKLGNVAQYLLDGMAYGRVSGQLRDEEINPLLDYVKDVMRQGLRLSTDGVN